MKTTGVWVSGQDAGNGSSSAVASLATGSITPGTGYQLVVTGMAEEVVGTYTTPSTFTLVDSAAYNPGTSWGIGMAYLVQYPGAAINPSWGLSPVSAGAVNVASFVGM
jgi:hypothetical protein